MIHPSTELRFVSPSIGYGIFATSRIRTGTIVYIKDPLEIEITQDVFDKYDPGIKEIVEKFSYIDERGVRIISWDHAKYVNHSCNCNSMSTGYGFEIAIRDIEEGEEITDEYGLFNIPYEIDLACDCQNCRKKLLPSDIDIFGGVWDKKVRNALRNVFKVEQPLWSFVDSLICEELKLLMGNKELYRSVKNLKYGGQFYSESVQNEIGFQ